MEKVYARTKGIQPDMVDGFCPGCMHSTLFKLIGEVLEEMNMLDKCTCAIGVGCCGLGMGYLPTTICWLPTDAPAPWPPA